MCQDGYEYSNEYTEEGWARADSLGWQLEDAREEIAELERELKRMRYFMSVRIDYDGERTVLDYYDNMEAK